MSFVAENMGRINEIKSKGDSGIETEITRDVSIQG